ncbi:hypothetical protein GUITHDRAFT_144422 [Guillardia theta CCMP2712]|uniref:AAA+ ATPase domain-containing protein n=1 Tax=Guillardia theta (strain CCMP2712) TaxID=905079 RepID=L1IPM1_GUITC|nr:hypothetical protein GUITHDRAFT_144422 [Guillardia theta CCMP2712]EKX38208.1 hypothetical protein GUITHDRAFT_144422 [Guillardia theta CCMP2712]|eukprot:XP_005825188.1 hypothetical protein GUITHDRAFT_144422 [Guillardia theta CCMP2712]
MQRLVGDIASMRAKMRGMAVGEKRMCMMVGGAKFMGSEACRGVRPLASDQRLYGRNGASTHCDGQPNSCLHSHLSEILVRGMSGRASTLQMKYMSLKGLEKDAKEYTFDSKRQLVFLQQLNQESMPERVISWIEGMKSSVITEEILQEYVKALKLKRAEMEKKKMYQSSRSDADGSTRTNDDEDRRFHSRSYDNQDPTMHPSMMDGSARRGMGSQSGRQTVHVAMAEPSAKDQVWRTIRILAGAYLFLLGLTTIMEERGLARGMMSNYEAVKPAESTKTFKDVVGVDEAKAELQEIVEFLRKPEKFTRLGGKMTKGVLLMGPPGTGKTLLAKAIAGEAGVPFFYASGSEFEEMYVGVGARRVRDLFEAAKRKAPCIIFLDEIDAIGATRNPKDQQYMRMTLNQLLAEMDGFSSSQGVVVIAATNFPEVLDKALTRPGRLDRHIVVPNPDVKGRKQILSLHLDKVPKHADVDVSILARGTPGFSGADLANLVNIAAIKASNDNKKAVDMRDLEFAKDRIMMGVERKSAVITEESRKLTAYHESGHAIVASFTDGALPVHKATVVPRGSALGMVMQLPDGDETSWSRRQMLAKMDVCMGGRVAEELIYGTDNVTSGASSDFEQATSIATNMVERWGMSDKVGTVCYKNLTGGDGEPIMGQEVRAAIDGEIKRLTSQAYSNAKKILTQHEDKLHLLAQELIEKETLTGNEVRAILGLPPMKQELEQPEAKQDQQGKLEAGKDGSSGKKNTWFGR